MNQHPLSPTLDDIDNQKADVYINQIKDIEKISSEKNIHNLALMGPYGSGKSTILLKLKNTDLNKYACISMLEFNESPRTTNDLKVIDDEDSSTKSTNKETEANTEQQTQQQIQTINNEVIENDIDKIEKSIVQQLLYQAPKNQIPFSKVRKDYPKKSLVSNSLINFLIFASLIFLFNIFSLFDYVKSFNFSSALFYISSIYFVFLTIYGCIALYHLFMYIFINFKISKIQITKSNASLELDCNSVYNKYIDEILYFFKNTKFDSVIFEDIDRYNDKLLFSHLRELNILLNKSDYLKNKKINFIYAIRDDLFENENRTKFFDFIVSIVPILDYSNSKIKLKNLVDDENISDSCLNKLSMYLSDFRILKNICNEYNTYKQIITNIFYHDKLLSLLTFKNLFPNEFSKLQFNNSVINKLIEKKKEIVEIERVKIQNEINLQLDALNQDIVLLDPTYTILSTINNLISPHINDDGYSNYTISGISGTHRYYTLKSFTEINVNWKEIKNMTSITIRKASSYPESISVPYYITEKFNKLYAYHENNDIIKDKTLLDIQNDIDNNNEKLSALNISRLCDIFNSETHLKDFDSVLDNYIKTNKINNPEFKSFIKTLISSDLIDENYNNYISVNYDNDNLSANDKLFIKNAYCNIKNDFNLNLTNIDFIYNELKDLVISNPNCFNINILFYIAKHDKNNLPKFLKTNASEIEKIYFELDESNKLFKQIAQSTLINCPNITNLLYQNKNNYAFNKWIKEFLVVSNEKFQNLPNRELLNEKIKNLNMFIVTHYNESEIDNLVKNMQTLYIKFKNIIGCEKNEYLKKCIINNSLYEFNFENLSHIDKSLSYEKLCSNENIKTYINEHLKEYLDILVKNNIKTVQSPTFNQLIISDVEDDKLISQYIIMNNIELSDFTNIQSDEVIKAVCKIENNIIPFLNTKNLKLNTLSQILFHAEENFAFSKNNALLVYEYIYDNNLFDSQYGLTKIFINLLRNKTIEQTKKDTIIKKVLSNKQLELIAKAYWRITKSSESFEVDNNALNLSICEQLKTLNLFNYEINEKIKLTRI